jgi:site-specific DNA recombinase
MKAVIYTRFSTTQQREASSEDQARNCRRKIEAEGWELGKHYKDEGVSGSTTERPGYQAMLAASVAREFEVLVIDDLSRLSRDQVESERVIRSLEFADVRIISVSDGYDSVSKSRKLQRGFKGLMNEMFLDDLRDKTHRGLAGQAIKKFWAGGKPYGYRLVQEKDATCLDSYGNAAVIGTLLEVDETQAAIVREIFEKYTRDYSQRAIAAVLNERAIPSPGSAWRGRTTRRTSGWLGSTLNELLANPLYRGELVWNKTEWRKNPDTGRRTMRPRPQSEWIAHAMPELRIISDDLWQRTLARRARAALRGDHVRAGLVLSGHPAGGGAKFAFSGLVKCGVCRSSLVIIGGQNEFRAYGCSGHKDGGPAVCDNGITVRRDILESRLLVPIKKSLLTPERIAAIEQRVNQKHAKRPKIVDNSARIRELREQISNITDAIASGLLKPSHALGERLGGAEAELARLTAPAVKPTARILDFPARLKARFNKMVDKLEENLARDPNRARAALREIVGEIPVFPHESRKYLVAKLGLSEMFLRAAVGSDTERSMVAGA